MKRLIVALACLAMAACTTTNVKTSTQTLSVPKAGARVLLVQPDVQLSVLTIAGIPEPKADWTNAARDNLRSQIQSSLAAGNHPVSNVKPDEAMEGKVGQLLRLHEAVGLSVLMFNYSGFSLPTKPRTGPFDWTLGEGAQALGQTYNADYALFVYARGSYSSAGRKVAMVGAALLGVGIAPGSQQAFASLVDLKTGQIVWFNMATAGPEADMRSPEGSKALVAALLKGAPL
ncbi:hypothetical protein QO010_004623 [Caulobacter ginsengisoli]|uniref:Lipoprotein n=1 Tax=Caulobacter ginsengisoli TaxID=400775 RepID=A0ABU0IXU0_9CAUL|nr:hypothetical protein [Caulobacter ginsengisoli]MDQ0466827.1 hypothetical protein [Caulobacter ginsengisoli]